MKGRKYDIRYFMLIGCTQPYIVLTNPGYARLSLEEYSTDNFGNGDKIEKTVHMTNNSIQRMHPKYKEMKESSIFSMD